MLKKVPDLHPDLLADLEALTMMFREVASVALASAYELGRRSMGAAPAQTVQPSPAAPAPVATSVDTEVDKKDDEIEGAEEEAIEPVDCATLPPLTAIQFQVFSVIAAARGEYVSSSQIDDRCGKNGAFGSLSAVRDKGYIRGRHVPGRPSNQRAYDVVCFGAPRVLGDGFEKRGHALSAAAPARKPTYTPETPRQEPPAPAAKPPVPAAPPPQIRREPVPAPVKAAPRPAPAPPPDRRPLPRRDPDAPLPIPSRRSVVDQGSMAVVFGADGNGGAGRPQEGIGNIKVSTYLIRKGHSVTATPGGWMIDGKYRDRLDTLDIVNRHRAAADLAPARSQDLE